VSSDIGRPLLYFSPLLFRVDWDWERESMMTSLHGDVIFVSDICISFCVDMIMNKLLKMNTHGSMATLLTLDEV